MLELSTTPLPLADTDAAVLITGVLSAEEVGTEGSEATGDGPTEAPPRPPRLTDGAAALLAAWDDPAAELLALGCDGSEGTTIRLRVPVDGGVVRTVLVVGLGSPERLDAERLRRAAGIAVRAVADSESLATDLAAPVTGTTGVSALAAATAVAEGVLLGAYRFEAYRSKARPTRLTRAALAAIPDDIAERAVTHARITTEATAWVRDLVNTPPRDKRPDVLAELVAAGVADTGVEVRILDDEALREGGYGGLVGVGQGSAVAARLVELRWTPPGATRHVALVGKGITFDSGGYSIKPSAGMETMKMDMAGAATVAAVIRAVARLRLPITVTGVLALAENLISGTAQRVSDVVTMRGGTTVEVMNTDAEGRLVLGDAIAHAGELEPDTIVDIATLTGAVVIALGDLIGGLMANDDTLADELLQAANAEGEPLWRLPLATDAYGKRVEGTVADLRNVAGREAGSIFGALFLARFVPDGIRWAHLDIAGTAWRDQAGPYHLKGGTGVPARTLITWLIGLASPAPSDAAVPTPIG
jgi:leucyl aminopeptidase